MAVALATTTLKKVERTPLTIDSGAIKPSALKSHAEAIRKSSGNQAAAAIDKLIEDAKKAILNLPERLQPLEAVAYVVKYDVREQYFTEAAHLERFKLGAVARRVSEQAKVGDRAMDILAEATGIHVNTLRQCRRLAELYDDNAGQFGQVLTAFRDKGNGPMRWYHIERIIGTYTDPNVLGPEALAERVSGGLERAAERAEHASGEGLDDTQKVILTDAARALRTTGLARLASAEGDSEKSIPRDPDFMRFVSKLPCCATQAIAPDQGWGEPVHVAVDPHHVGGAGTAIKGSDYTCIPLAREPHDYYHQHGLKSFERKYNVNVLAEMFQTLHLYFFGVRAQLPAAATSK